MKAPPRGEIRLVDLGLAAKVRPALALSVPASDADRSLVTLVPHTTSVRGSRFEVPSNVRFLQAGAFDAQGIITVPLVRLARRLGRLSPERFARVEAGVRLWLGFGLAQPASRGGSSPARGTGVAYQSVRIPNRVNAGSRVTSGRRSSSLCPASMRSNGSRCSSV